MNACFRAIVVSLILSACMTAVAYEEWNLPNLTVPTLIRPFALEASIQHQFQGSVGDTMALTHFFGIGDGASIDVGVRSVIWSTLQAYATYSNYQRLNYSSNLFLLGTAYAIPVHPLFLRTQVDGQFFSYDHSFPEKRRNSFFVLAALQNDPIYDRVTVVVNGAYDFDKKRFGLGLGLDVKLAEAFDVFGTYYPMVDKPNDTTSGLPPAPTTNAFAFGVKITTAGHQFFLYSSNTTEVGTRLLMRGAPDNRLKIGFMIKRLFVW
jgi:hypothetical protein